MGQQTTATRQTPSLMVNSRRQHGVLRLSHSTQRSIQTGSGAADNSNVPRLRVSLQLLGTSCAGAACGAGSFRPLQSAGTERLPLPCARLQCSAAEY